MNQNHQHFTFFNLLLRKNWANMNQTWQEWSLGSPHYKSYPKSPTPSKILKMEICKWAKAAFFDAKIRSNVKRYNQELLNILYFLVKFYTFADVLSLQKQSVYKLIIFKKSSSLKTTQLILPKFGRNSHWVVSVLNYI